MQRWMLITLAPNLTNVHDTYCVYQSINMHKKEQYVYTKWMVSGLSLLV